MNRKNFLKKLGLGAAVATVVPSALAEKPEEIPFRLMIDEAVIPNGMTLEEFAEQWRKNNGTIIYQKPPASDFIKIESSDGILYIKRHPFFEGNQGSVLDLDHI